MWKFFKKTDKSAKIPRKTIKITINPKVWFKNFLVKFANLPQQTSIDDVIKTSMINLIDWVLSVLITGCLIHLALFPVYYYGLGFAQTPESHIFLIISYGLIWWIFLKIHQKVQDLVPKQVINVGKG